MIEFYDYFDHLKKHGFKWENSLISYEVKLSSARKNLIKKFQHPYDPNEIADELSKKIKYRDLANHYNLFNCVKNVPSYFTKDKFVDEKDIERISHEIIRNNEFKKQKKYK